MPSRTTVECAVRMIVVAISSAIDWSAFATIWSVTGSVRHGESRLSHRSPPARARAVAVSR